MLHDAKIREFLPSDWAAAVALWRCLPGIGLSASDGQAEIASFLAHNPGLSLVAVLDEHLLGTVLAGSDGRRGYLYHACVAPDHQGMGIGRALIEAAIKRLTALGLVKISLYCKADNVAGRAFWEHLGWQRRDDLVLFSHEL